MEEGIKNIISQLNGMLDALRKEKIVFSATLGIKGDFGPFSSRTVLIYKNVIVNTGNGYDASTGVFTAPRKGIYFFNFSGHNFSSRNMGLILMKNDKLVTIVYNHVAGQRHETATNGAAMELNKGDRVYMQLYENTWIFDNENCHSTFTGFLITPL